MSKMQNYKKLKLREKAVKLAGRDGILYSDALKVVEDERNKADDAKKKLQRQKSKSRQKKEARIAAKERERRSKTFGVKLISGAGPLQGGAPGLGKKK